MTPSILMLIGFILFLIGVMVGLRNFLGLFSAPAKVTAKEALAKADGANDDDAFVSAITDTMKTTLLTHLVAGLFASAGFLSLIGGFIWFLVIKHG